MRGLAMMVAGVSGLLCLTLAATPPDELRITAASQLSSEGDLFSEVELVATGEVAAAMRKFVTAQAVDELFAAVQQVLSRTLPEAQLVSVRFAALDETIHPFHLLLQYQVSGFALVGQSMLAFGLPASRLLWADGPPIDWLLAGRAAKLESEVALHGPLVLAWRERLTLPAGLRLTAPWSAAVTTTAGTLSASLVDVDGVIELSQEIGLQAQRVDAFSLPGLAALVAAFDQIAAQRFIAETPGGQP